MRYGFAALAAAVAVLGLVARADDMSGADKLRLLYSHRFTFTRDGLPLVTVGLMERQEQVRLEAERGVRVMPDGDGGPEIRAGASWTVRAENARAGTLRWWVVVSRRAPDALTTPDETVALWAARGFKPKTFETGVVFAVEGDVIDSREVLLGVLAEADRTAAERTSRILAERWKVATFVYPELALRPQGIIVAREDRTGVEVRNANILWFRPEIETESLILHDVVVGEGGSQRGATRRETRRYRGRIYVTLGVDGRLTVVNAVSEDHLLAGLLPQEIFPDAPVEALKAQAVAARDELLAKIGTRHFGDPYLICATQHCQVYGGAGPEDPRTTRAVQATRGEVLLRDNDGGLVVAYYSASCGGFSENNDNIWAALPDYSLRGKLDALGEGTRSMAQFAAGISEHNVAEFLGSPVRTTFCSKTKYARDRYRWTVRVPSTQLDALVAEELPELGSVRDLRPLTRGVSGRIRRIEIVGTKGRVVVEGDLKIRRLLGGLRSTLFLIQKEGQDWVFVGAGFGHGVGLCQTGAIGMAESGYDYLKILRHYYPGSHVRRLY